MLQYQLSITPGSDISPSRNFKALPYRSRPTNAMLGVKSMVPHVTRPKNHPSTHDSIRQKLLHSSGSNQNLGLPHKVPVPIPSRLVSSLPYRTTPESTTDLEFRNSTWLTRSHWNWNEPTSRVGSSRTKPFLRSEVFLPRSVPRQSKPDFSWLSSATSANLPR
ncbi:hypothetical protein K402DRAFT_31693 [Aulographum hederae CBS 113979]|uniref:Uncharacterized protein n=1 Tax=Aulographum hederae CBS 113979 TaxID=1176131 RepID=A0A6G1H4U1_9PEZI|nr:hypothetical protein K402DRAFT_31693 [Aulographum hederae CBS 113979]